MKSFTFIFFMVLLKAGLFAQTTLVKYAENPILPLGDPGEWDDGNAAFASVLFDGSIYQMWYSGSKQPNYVPRRIGYATSFDGFNWNKHAQNPVIPLGVAGQFDAFDVWIPMVLFDGSHYEMWYTGDASGNFDWSIGYATATDPAQWTKHSGPVLTTGNPGEWDDDYTAIPIVIHSDSLYRMWYTGNSASGIWQTGYATSIDGIIWSKHSGNPVLSVGALGEWDAAGAVASSVIFEDGQYQMWYQGTDDTTHTGLKDIAIGFATSPDGIFWTKDTLNNPILSQGSDWDAVNVWFPRVIKDGNRYRMWYQGRNSNGIDRIGYAEDFSNAAHTDSIRVSPDTVTAASDTVYFDAYIANPHSENLSARTMIKIDGGTVIDSVDLNDTGNGIWQGVWMVPAGGHNYSVGVKLHNISAGYLHNSFDWNVFGEFSSIVGGLIDDKQGNIPSQITLKQNYPNPFNPWTVINYSLTKKSEVQLIIYDINGREIKTLVNQVQNYGEHSIGFNASSLASGVYIYKLKAGSFEQSRKMLLLR